MAEANTQVMSTAETVVRSLMAQGLRQIFCVPGVQNDDFFDALHRVGGSIRPIHTRHEQATAYMALGAAQATGMPQAYCVVPGPGFLNTTAALSTALATSAPVLAIAGQIPDRFVGRRVGLLHEIPDQLAIMRGLTKWAERMTGPDDAAEKVRAAFSAMLSGAPGPAGLECPANVWRREGQVAFDASPITRQGPPLDGGALDRAAALIRESRRPLIIVGSGAQSAAGAVARLAEVIEAPVAAWRTGPGVLDSRHRLAIMNAHAHVLWKQADLVIGIGTRLQQALDWGLDAGLKTIHIEADANRIGITHDPTVAVVADATDAVDALLARLDEGAAQRGRRDAELKQVRDDVAGRAAKLAPQKAWIDAIRAGLPDDGILVNELTQIGYANHLFWPAYRPRTFLSPGYQGTLGWGYAAALGAKVAKPNSAVVSLNGDGGFMFGVQELATAAHHAIGVVALVFNDGAFGNVKRIQQMHYGGRTIAVDFTNPDFVRLGESFGVASQRVSEPAALTRALTKAIDADKPALIEVPFRLADFPNPWDLILGLARQRGDKA
jgi:acetolactate synthase-1/2/3 large subunit